MVRKVPAILKIEGLSDGVDPTARDDFTQEPLAQPHAKAPKVDDAQAWMDERNRAKAEEARAWLEALRSKLAEPKPVAPRVEGMRAAGTLRLKDGQEMAVYVSKASFRRI